MKRPGAIHHGDPAYNRTLSLTDGGAYDNLGLETVDDFSPVVVSDAGAPFGMEDTASSLWPKQAMRALDIATDQARALRKRFLFAQCAAEGRVPAYSGIDCDPKTYPAPQTIKAAPATIRRLARLRTRLDPFSEEEQSRLINWGWLMTDVAMRSWVTQTVPTPSALPIPAFPLT